MEEKAPLLPHILFRTVPESSGQARLAAGKGGNRRISLCQKDVSPSLTYSRVFASPKGTSVLS